MKFSAKKNNQAQDINWHIAQGPILPLLIRLTIPAAMSQLVNALYSIVDRMYIGHLPEIGTLALGSVGLTFPITTLISAFACLPGMGGAPLASIAIGQGDTRKAQRYLNQAALLLLIISAVMTVLCLAFLEPILLLFGADATTLPYAQSYLQIYLLGTVFVEFALGLNPFINTQGFLFTGTISVIIGAVLNIVLDPLLMYVLKLDVRGAALATVLSQMVSCVWVLGFLCSSRSGIRLSCKEMHFHGTSMTEICTLGVSPFTFRLNESLVMILLNRLLRIYGGTAADLHLASMTILNSISQIFFMPLLGVVNGAQPILSYNFGARNYERVHQTVHYARILSFGCAAFMWAVIMIFPQGICLLFNNDPQLVELTTVTLRIMFCTSLALGFQMINQNAFVAVGNTGYSFFFGIMRKLLILIPLAFILPRYLGVWGIYAAEAISNPVTTLVTFVVFSRYLHKIRVSWATDSCTPVATEDNSMFSYPADSDCLRK